MNNSKRNNTANTCVDVCIIGAGAAGMMCAIEAAKRGKKVVLLDKATQAGKKILISGGGRCNFTNLYTDASAYISHNTHFCKSALARYTQWDFIHFIETNGLTWHEKTLGQLFCDQKAKAIRDLLLDECTQWGIKLYLNCTLHTLEKTTDNTTNHYGFSIQSNQGHINASALVIACGGPSIPRMGSTDFGLQIAKQFGIKNHPFYAGLVPFTFSQSELEQFFKPLAGIALAVTVSCNNQHFKENILFTHRGMSGPAVLQISSYWKKGDVIIVDMLPEKDAQALLLSAQNNNPNLLLKNVLKQHLPTRLAECISETTFVNKPLKHYTSSEISQIAQQLKHWEFTPSGTEGMRTAEVALGGIDTNELSSKTFECRKVKGLYFIGETLDVTGHLGGYNFQWAWSSGWCAGQYV